MHSKYTNQRKFHKLVGAALLTPFIVWSLTGIFFLLRPPFFEAYERIPVKSYPLRSGTTISPESNWLETRQIQSILGEHLLARDENGWHHLLADSNEVWNLPDETSLKILLEDAIQFNPDRYGKIVEVSGSEAITDTGIRITVDWQTLSISQEGQDGIWIDRIYNLHYLRWTGITWLDEILGIVCLCLLLYMTVSGTRMIHHSNNNRDTNDNHSGG